MALVIKGTFARNAFSEATTILAFEQARRIVLVSDSDLFTALSPAERAKVAELARPRHFMKGDILFSQGQPFRKLLLLESGHVKLTLLNTHGKEVILAFRRAGEAIDLPTGCTHSPHSCSAQAVVSGRALIWSAIDVDWMMAAIPKLTENMYAILHRQMLELERRYHEAASDSVARRLACTLIRLAELLGMAEGQGVEIRVSRHELAQMSGMTLFTVSRLISRWSKLGLVVPRREALVVLDPNRLDEITSFDESPGEENTAVS